MKEKAEGSLQSQRTKAADNVPYKFLARFDNRMPLRYRKLWFQLTCPRGRIRIIVHPHTKDAASCTAEVYLDKKDSKPVSACTAACSRKEAENFLKAAENRALTGALIQAGFTRPEKLTPVPTRQKPPRPEPVSPVGNQLPDGQLLPSSEKEGNAQNQEKPIHKEKALPDANIFQTVDPADPIPFPVSGQIPTASLPSREVSEQKETGQTENQRTDAPISASSGRTGKPEALIPPAAAKEPEVPQPSTGQIAYTSYTPVEEIKKDMTLEDALLTRVNTGACQGMTLEEVCRERFPFLRWYVYGYNGNDNILRAASQIVWDSLPKENKAG